ncbi:ribosome small subunit-dependent GTPase A [Pseudomonadota bacterium]
MVSNTTSLAALGWQAYFQQQLSLDEWDNATPARVVEQYKSEITVATESDIFNISLLAAMPEMVVGDWLLLDSQHQLLRLLERKTCFSRKAAGSKLKKQLISANVDTAFIVCSMNDDFNLNRIERFLALVNESGAEPVVLLSKSDQVDAPEYFVERVQELDPFLMIEQVNCLAADSVSKLSPWIKEGITIAVLGSSGVGKSTLVNTLAGEERQSTAGIREDDDKGRHTTTRRSLIALSGGGLILDTPGMREIQLADCKEGIATTFSDIEAYASQCKFNNCQHQGEPGCAVQQAIEAGDLNQRRLNNYLKLLREEAINSASLSERRANDKALGKFYKNTLSESLKLKGR